MRLTSTGLGIGTSSPATKLHVVGASQLSLSAAGTQQVLQLSNNDGTAGTQAVKLGFSSSGATKASINAAVYGNDYMTFNVGSDTERMRIDASGNVGIGQVRQQTSWTYLPILLYERGRVELRQQAVLCGLQQESLLAVFGLLVFKPFPQELLTTIACCFTPMVLLCSIRTPPH